MSKALKSDFNDFEDALINYAAVDKYTIQQIINSWSFNLWIN